MFMNQQTGACPFCGNTQSIGVVFNGEPLRRCCRSVCLKTFSLNADGATKAPQQTKSLLRFENTIRNRKV